MAVWYFGKPDIPPQGLALSFAALLVPVIGTFWFPETVVQYELLLWLLALVPAFLLSYYRGWTGVAVAMAAGMAVLAVVQLVVVLFDIETDWLLLFAVVGAYIFIGLSIGYISSLLHEEREQAERLALKDDLTGIPNRRLANLILEREFAAARRGRSLAVVLFDLDRFKAYNDRHGHAAGDRALRVFVDVLASRTRRMDLSARYGGEEFVTVLSGGHEPGGVQFAESVRAGLAEIDGGPPFTVSAGVTEYTPDMESLSDLMATADDALYRAKAEGRDRVVAYHEG